MLSARISMGSLWDDAQAPTPVCPDPADRRPCFSSSALPAAGRSDTTSPTLCAALAPPQAEPPSEGLPAGLALGPPLALHRTPRARRPALTLRLGVRQATRRSKRPRVPTATRGRQGGRAQTAQQGRGSKRASLRNASQDRSAKNGGTAVGQRVHGRWLLAGAAVPLPSRDWFSASDTALCLPCG